MQTGSILPQLLTVLLTLATTPMSARAQGMPDPDQMMKVGQCMANLDPAAMEAMHQRGEAFQTDLKRLCKAGDRAGALQRARQFGLQMVDDPVMKQIKACTAGLAMPQQHYAVAQEKLTPNDICSP